MKPVLCRIIEVKWEESHSITHDAFQGKATLNKLPVRKECLYQIYGDSPIYGMATLLYIGKTGREPKTRLSQHLRSKFSRQRNLSVRIGSIKTDPDCDVSMPELLAIAESILIATHKPSHNIEFIDNLSVDALKACYLVHNHGNRGLLSLECSSFWWCRSGAASDG
jgi:hypothetical protein